MSRKTRDDDIVGTPGGFQPRRVVPSTEPIGAQPSDPAWARLLFVLVEGGDGQWWRGLLLVTPAGLLVVTLAAVLALAGWVGGALGVGSLTAGTAALARHRRHTSR